MTPKKDQFNALKKSMAKFLEERDWVQYHTPKNIAMSIAIEAAELMEIFQWTNPSSEDISSDLVLLAQIRDELADILIYSISMGLQLKIDLFSCVKDKMDKNNERFPPKNMKINE
ncbi:MAG: nucleotide pyrophosphohydrolase [Candidatus Heimdallarchaeota archaeon]|nr:nucleotide pyrophosphohydrolase [Candidatus Heimdallarchaeota archaeon]